VVVARLRSVQLARRPRSPPGTGVSWDTEKLQQTVQTAVHMLDNGIDLHCGTTSETRRCNLYQHPIGFSIGWQDARYAMKMSYVVTYAVEFTDQSREIVSYGASRSATALAVDRSSTMDGSPLCRQAQKESMGNADVTAITPTAASGDVCGTSPPIESNLCAEFTGLNACWGAALRVRDLGIPIMRRGGKARDSSLRASGDLYRLA